MYRTEHEMTESGLRRRLSEAFSNKRLEDPPDDLRTELDAFVDECWSQGDPPERMLLKLKAMIAEARLAAHAPKRQPSSDAEQAFVQQLVADCIASYYKDRG